METYSDNSDSVPAPPSETQKISSLMERLNSELDDTRAMMDEVISEIDLMLDRLIGTMPPTDEKQGSEASEAMASHQGSFGQINALIVARTEIQAGFARSVDRLKMARERISKI